MTQAEYEKILKKFESLNPTVENFILLTTEGKLLTYIGIPFHHSEGLSYIEAVRYAGLISDVLLLTKKTLDTFKTMPPNTGNMTMRFRLRNGKEIIIVQEQDMYLLTIQVCKIFPEDLEEDKK